MTRLPTTPPRGTDSPYPGLRPYLRDEADLFFGRDEQVAQVLGRLHEARFLAVVGTSGCGKSSLVYAGIIPALETYLEVTDGSNLMVVALRPGRPAAPRPWPVPCSRDWTRPAPPPRTPSRSSGPTCAGGRSPWSRCCAPPRLRKAPTCCS